MAQSVPSSVCVIGSEFMAPYPFDTIVDPNSGGNLVITDINHKILLKVKPCNTTLHHQRVILYPDGRPIVKLREKILSEHSRWKVFMGDSTDSSKLIFSTKQPNMIQFKTSLQVILTNKTSKKNVCDFKIKGSWSKRKCTISMGDSDSLTVIAQMNEIEKSKKEKFDKDKFLVTIYPNVDYAFVVALIAIIDAMNNIDNAYGEQISASTSEVIFAAASC